MAETNDKYHQQQPSQQTSQQQEEQQPAASDVDSDGFDDEDDEQQRQEAPPPELYDPTADDADDRWAARQRRGRGSDAVLSCPACFTTICLDCQQHEAYPHQFRAVFAMNTATDTAAAGGLPAAGGGPKRVAGKRRAPGAGVAEPTSEGQQRQQQDTFYAVACAECGADVGMRGTDGVYVFFHVLASTA